MAMGVRLFLAGLSGLLFAIPCRHPQAQQSSQAPQAPTAASTPNKAGTVDLLEGDVRFYKSDKALVTPAIGSAVYAGDSIVTGANGEVHFKMEDGGVLAVRPNTKMRIAQFQANGDAGDKSVLGLLQGGLRSITGWIGKFNPNGYQIRATVATIGIRGTDHETHVRVRDDAEGEAGVYDRVYEGGTFIRTDQGRVDVTPNRAGFSSAKPGQRPRLLDKIPTFFRPTKNEGRLKGLHQRLQPLLEKQRSERQVKVKATAKEQRAKAAEARKPEAGKGKRDAAEKRKQAQEEKTRRAQEEKKKHAKEHAGKKDPAP